MPKHGSRKPESSLGRTAQDGHLDSHTAPELCWWQQATAIITRTGLASCWRGSRHTEDPVMREVIPWDTLLCAPACKSTHLGTTTTTTRLQHLDNDSGFLRTLSTNYIVLFQEATVLYIQPWAHLVGKEIQCHGAQGGSVFNDAF